MKGVIVVLLFAVTCWFAVYSLTPHDDVQHSYDSSTNYGYEVNDSPGRLYPCSDEIARDVSCVGHLIDGDEMTKVEAVALIVMHMPYERNKKIQPWVRDALCAVGREDEARSLFSKRAITSEYMNELATELMLEDVNDTEGEGAY